MKRIASIGVAAALIAVLGSAAAGAASNPRWTSITYDRKTQTLSLQWSLPTLATCQFGFPAVCQDLDIVGESFSASTSPSTTDGKLTFPTLIWASDDATRLSTSLTAVIGWDPGTYYLQLDAVGVEDDCFPVPPIACDQGYQFSPVTFDTVSSAAPFLITLPPGPPPPPVRCVVPRVVGRPLGAAKRLIRARHCSLGRVQRVRSPRVGRVLRQSPARGTRLPRGGRVSLLVGRA